MKGASAARPKFALQIAEQVSARVARSRLQKPACAALRASGKSSFEPHRILERRKHDVAPSVIVLDAVSQILPDDTYVTALEIEGDKVRISGVTRDAPPLIALMERSNRFARATFFAPTTRSPSDQGERFHIEANIQPLQPSP